MHYLLFHNSSCEFTDNWSRTRSGSSCRNTMSDINVLIWDFDSSGFEKIDTQGDSFRGRFLKFAFGKANYFNVVLETTVGCIYPWTLALKTCFQLTSNVYVSGVKLWSFPAQTRACVISNVYISGVKLWIFSAQTRSSLDRVSALVVHCHRSLENMRKTCENHWYVAKFQSLIPET